MDVLIVDDTPGMLLLLQHAVENRGHTSTTCADGACAIEAFRIAPYPLILLDWEMPGMSGIEMIPLIRALPGGEVANIVLVTGKSDPDDLRRALEAGADDYITKPFGYELLDVRLTVAEQQCKMRADRYRIRMELVDSMQQIAASSDDMLSILNQICIGTVLTDDDENIRFISHAACAIFDVDSAQAVGNPWQSVFPFKESDLMAVREVANLPSSERQPLQLQLRTVDKYYWVEVMVRDDPRGIHNRIFVFNDVTEVYDLREQLGERAVFESIVGKSPPMMQLYQQIQEISNVDITVMICGETGSGKELVAKAIHSTSHRNDKPFIAVNCAGLTDSLLTSQLFGHQRGAFTGAVKDQKGFFEEADGGTLFLDEIGEISMNVQTALLRVLQEREVVRVGENRPRKIDVRLITATNRNLPDEVEQGNFRADLMYRIRVAEIQLPALRERLGDIPLLVNTFLSRFCALTGKKIDGISNSALRTLTDHQWPGNVRELENAIEVAAVRSKDGIIQRQDLPTSLLPHVDRESSSQQTDVVAEKPVAAAVAPEDARQNIIDALSQANGNRKEAAKLLGIGRATLYRHMDKFAIDA